MSGVHRRVNSALPGVGDVDGPASATDNAIARFDGTTGKLIQNSVGILSDAGALSGLTAITVTGLSSLIGGQVRKTTVPGAYPYAVLSTDYVVLVDTTGANTVQLPDAPTTDQVFVIKDTSGMAATNNITLTTVGGVVTIDGATSVTMSLDWESLTVIFDGTNYRII